MSFLEGNLKLPIRIVTNCVEETRRFAKSLGEIIKPFQLSAFFGGLGVGKTAFIRGFSEAFGVDSFVCSPTFSIINEYMYDEFKKIVHCDMYRISTEEDLYGTGFFDILKDKNAIVLVEWSENILSLLPEDYIKIEIKVLSKEKREINVDGKTN